MNSPKGGLEGPRHGRGDRAQFDVRDGPPRRAPRPEPGRPMRFPALLILASVCAAARGEDGDIVINEILDRSPGGGDDVRFVELFHRGTAEADLSGWTIAGGIRFTFPEKTRMAPGSY